MTPANKWPQRRAFTVVELMVASTLMVILALVLSNTWSGFGAPLVNAMASAQITRQAHLAVAALSRDFGGYLANPSGRLGGLGDSAFVGRMQPGNTVLRLCFDGGSPPDGVAEWGAPDTVITYQVQDGNLIRWDETAGTTFTVARYVEQLAVSDLGNGAELQITFVYRNITRTYTFVGLESMKKHARREGYAMVLVLVFMVLLFSLSSMAYRQVATTLRTETVRTAQVTCDQGSLQAVANAISLLETGTPPTNPFQYAYTTTTASGPQSFTVNLSSGVTNEWTIQAAPSQPGDSVEQLPTTFAPPDE